MRRRRVGRSDPAAVVGLDGDGQVGAERRRRRGHRWSCHQCSSVERSGNPYGRCRSGIHPGRRRRHASCHRSRSSVRCGSTRVRGSTIAGEVGLVRPGADGEAGEERRRRARSPRARATPRPARCAASASACTNVGLRAHPAVDAQDVDRDAGVGLGRLDEVGAAVGDALEHGPHELGPAGAAGEAEHGAARAVVPLRACRARAARARTTRRRCRCTAPRPRATPPRARDDAEVVAQPLHVRAGRQHDRLDAPRVRRRRRCRQMIGNVPPPPRVSNVGPLGAEDEVEHPAGAERDLRVARRARTPWPSSDACWSPTSPAIGGAPGSAVACADDPARVDDASAASPPGCAATRAVRRPSSVPSAAQQAGDRRRCCASVTCTAPSESVHATHESTVPKHRSRVRSGSTWSSRYSTLVAETFGREPEARRPAARGTCRSCGGPASRWPGPTGSPVAAVPDDRRAALVGDPDRVDGPPCAVERGRAASSAAVGRARRGSNSTRPGAGESGSSVSQLSLVRAIAAGSRRSPPAPTTSRRRRRGRSRPGDRGRRRGRGGRACPGSGCRSGRAPASPRRARRTPSPSASRTNRARLRPTPWWWLSAPPCASTARVPASHAAR